jgi:hypothetical protein
MQLLLTFNLANLTHYLFLFFCLSHWDKKNLNAKNEEFQYFYFLFLFVSFFLNILALEVGTQVSKRVNHRLKKVN